MDTGRQRPRVGKQGLMLLGGQCGDLDLRLWACGIVLGGKVGHMQRSCNHLIAVSLSFCTPPLKKKNGLAMSHSIWKLSSPIRDQTHALCIGSVEF